MVFYPGKWKNNTAFFGKVFFQWACRIVLGPPKHVLHLVWSVPDISTALKVAEWPKSCEKEGQYYKVNLFGFEMGPSVKFVLAIIDAFSKKKMGVNFFHRKKS